jgi:hypothetical protein
VVGVQGSEAELSREGAIAAAAWRGAPIWPSNNCRALRLAVRVGRGPGNAQAVTDCHRAQCVFNIRSPSLTSWRFRLASGTVTGLECQRRLAVARTGLQAPSPSPTAAPVRALQLRPVTVQLNSQVKVLWVPPVLYWTVWQHHPGLILSPQRRTYGGPSRISIKPLRRSNQLHKTALI